MSILLNSISTNAQPFVGASQTTHSADTFLMDGQTVGINQFGYLKSIKIKVRTLGAPTNSFLTIYRKIPGGNYYLYGYLLNTAAVGYDPVTNVFKDITYYTNNRYPLNPGDSIKFLHQYGDLQFYNAQILGSLNDNPYEGGQAITGNYTPGTWTPDGNQNADAFFELKQAPPISTVIKIDNYTCNNDSNLIKITASGGMPSYTYRLEKYDSFAYEYNILETNGSNIKSGLSTGHYRVITWDTDDVTPDDTQIVIINNLTSNIPVLSLGAPYSFEQNCGTGTFSMGISFDNYYSMFSPIIDSFNVSPTLGTLYGDATYLSSGQIRIVPEENEKQGRLIYGIPSLFDTLFSEIVFDMKMLNKDGADGLSFNFGKINTTANGNENGILLDNDGLVVKFLNYGNDSIKIDCNGVQIVGINSTLEDGNWHNYKIVTMAENDYWSGETIKTIRVYKDDVSIIYTTLPNTFTIKNDYRTAFAGRTGGLNNEMVIDNYKFSQKYKTEFTLDNTATWNSPTIADLAPGTYIVKSRATGSCRVDSLTTITVNPNPSGPVVVDTIQYLCSPNPKLADITVTGIGTTKWWSEPTGGTPLDVNAIISDGYYYVSQIVDGCNGPRTKVQVFKKEPSVMMSYVGLCASEYTWRGNTYTTSGIYTDSFINIYGCDSVYVLNLSLGTAPGSVNPQSDVAICNAENPNIVFTGSVPNSHYYWYADNNTMGNLASGIDSFTINSLVPNLTLDTVVTQVTVVPTTRFAINVVDTYFLKGYTEKLIVPTGVSKIKIEAYGGKGANTGSGDYLATGGKGGYVYGTFNVNAGDTLKINVGGAGNGRIGGYNGGGSAGDNGTTENNGGGGGGRSEVKISNSSINEFLLIANGGGGAGGSGYGFLVDDLYAGQNNRKGGNGGSGHVNPGFYATSGTPVSSGTHFIGRGDAANGSTAGGTEEGGGCSYYPPGISQDAFPNGFGGSSPDPDRNATGGGGGAGLVGGGAGGNGRRGYTTASGCTGSYTYYSGAGGGAHGSYFINYGLSDNTQPVDSIFNQNDGDGMVILTYEIYMGECTNDTMRFTIKQNPPAYKVDTIRVCNASSYVWPRNNVTYYGNANTSVRVEKPNGCDSFYFLDLKFGPNYNYTYSVSDTVLCIGDSISVNITRTPLTYTLPSINILSFDTLLWQKFTDLTHVGISQGATSIFSNTTTWNQNSGTYGVGTGTPKIISDFSALPPINLTAGQTYTFNLVDSFDASDYPMIYGDTLKSGFTIAVDLNNNSYFEYSELLYYEGEDGQSKYQRNINIPILIPLNAISGLTRMRIAQGMYSFYDNKLIFGESEDYTVNITGGLSYQPEVSYNGNIVGNASPTTFEPLESGTLMINLKSPIGCDKINTKPITVNGVLANDTVTTCGIYRWNGLTLTASGNYSSTTPNADGCDTLNRLNLTVTSGNLVLAGSGSDSIIHTANTINDYYDTDCELIATIQSGTDPLNNVISNVTVTTTVETYLGQPYVPRYYDINAANNTGGTITLYYTQSDFDLYNASPGEYPTITPSADNLMMTIFHSPAGTGGLGPNGHDTASKQLVTPTSVVWNATNNWWEVTFPVDSFSGFYAHTVKPGGGPLPILLGDISAKNIGREHLVTWNSLKEENGAIYTLYRSNNGRDFDFMEQIPARGTPSEYSFVDVNPYTGTTYYRLKMTNPDGTVHNSKIVNATLNSASADIEVFPNPTDNILNVRIKGHVSENAIIFLVDNSGKVVDKLSLAKNQNNLALDMSQYVPGVYYIKYKDNGIERSIKVTKL